jgi:glycosyltransferase involved in cell wall biosynthesis
MISVIIPAYNEEGNIPRIDSELVPVLESLKEPYEILVINDGSKDKTREEILNLKNKKSRLIEHPENMGLGQAVRTGINNSKGNIIVTYEADFTWAPHYVKELMETQEKTGADCVIGSHFHKYGKLEGHGKLKPRILMSKAVNLMYQILLGKRIFSTSSLFRVYRAEPLKKLSLTSSGFSINAEILTKMVMRKNKIVEVPVVLTKRKFGESKINVPKAIKGHLEILSKTLYWKLFSGR